MRLAPAQPEDVGQQALGEHVAADDALGHVAALIGEVDHFVLVQRHQPIADHPLQRRGHSRRGHPHALGQPGTDDRRPVARHEVHELKIVFDRLAGLAVHSLQPRRVKSKLYVYSQYRVTSHSVQYKEQCSRSAMKIPLKLRVNGDEHELVAPVQKTLLEVLREELDLTGTKHGCELGECGACAVLIDGQPILSCLALPIEHQAPSEIVTVEGLAKGAQPHPLQDTFAELGAAQCGYCTPGMLVTAKALLDTTPAPTRAQITEALSGNLCRCTGYVKIFEAVELAAQRLRPSAPGSRSTSTSSA